ncbi:MAG: hypothetical protein ACSLE2_11000 [Lysobacterales bacterium]
MKQARQRQEDPLNLQSLPLVSPPRDGWPAVEAALSGDTRRRTVWRYAAGALGVAATVTLAVGLYWQESGTVGAGAADVAQVTGPVPTVPAGERLVADEFQSPARPAPAAGTLDSMIALSQQLEGRLRGIRAEAGSLRSSAVVYQVELEDLVAQVDEELSRQPDSLPLWNQRVSLLMDLERLYENSLRREYHRIASL